MSRGSKIRIDDAEIEIYLSTKAMLDISELMDKPFSEISEWLTAEDLQVEVKMARISDVIGTLANAAIFKHNSQIRMHLKSGELKEFFNVSDFREILNLADMEHYFEAITSCIREDNAVIVPDEIKIAEEDEVLKELEEEKNQPAGDAETV